ncbi:hypothetical protein [Nonomuraea sp. PA05]|uniref:hypothetical protein n=1 Tax=Nonomuraea sp. PA05 TaxID=2604466 RepID=UPI001651F102|nr:hypothetical protein [Nonomuraea sp. PA05]
MSRSITSAPYRYQARVLFPARTCLFLFEVLDPPELVPHLREMAARLGRAAGHTERHAR